MMPYEKFEAWRVSHRLVLTTYATTEKWPKHELYGLIAQVRRAACSVPMNIAEGAAKKGNREFRRYLDISLGSLSEVSYCLLLGRDLGYLSESEWRELDELRNRCANSSGGYIKQCRKRQERLDFTRTA